MGERAEPVGAMRLCSPTGGEIGFVIDHVAPRMI
jgi:hypothetical protein